MKNSRKITTVIAASLIAFLSIYAAVLSTFNTTNNTAQTVTVALQLQSGPQINVTVAPATSIPTSIGGDQVMGLTLYGVYAPAGATISIPNPTGGKVLVSWRIDGGGACSGTAIDTDEAG